MTPQQIEAMKLALEALKACNRSDMKEVNKAITAIEEALAQTQEPVCDKDPQGCWNVRCQLGKKCKNTPPQRTWVGLTDEETSGFTQHEMAVVKYVNKVLQEKNT